MRKPARQDHHVRVPKRGLLVPDEARLLAQHVFGGVIGVVIAVGSRKDDDPERHWPDPCPSSIVKLSMTGFASTRSATSAASFSAAARSGTFRSISKNFPWRTSATSPYPSECRASTIV